MFLQYAEVVNPLENTFSVRARFLPKLLKHVKTSLKEPLEYKRPPGSVFYFRSIFSPYNETTQLLRPTFSRLWVTLLSSFNCMCEDFKDILVFILPTPEKSTSGMKAIHYKKTKKKTYNHFCLNTTHLLD